MNNSNNKFPEEIQPWKVWTTLIIGPLLAGQVVILGEVGKDEVFLEVSHKIGFSIGMGLFAALLMWSAFYFAGMRKMTRQIKWSAFGLMFIVASLATFTQLG